MSFYSIQNRNGIRTAVAICKLSYTFELPSTSSTVIVAAVPVAVVPPVPVVVARIVVPVVVPVPVAVMVLPVLVVVAVACEGLINEICPFG